MRTSNLHKYLVIKLLQLFEGRKNIRIYNNCYYLYKNPKFLVLQRHSGLLRICQQHYQYQKRGFCLKNCHVAL
ncbi:MAG: hypothetical protein AMJ79_06840 [Phycisphaerae bacterium SM23_30]|nr:MAG: hypothetical protein AMJ79_06840 [Phycisphaerae bacterium SM23_30]